MQQTFLVSKNTGPTPLEVGALVKAQVTKKEEAEDGGNDKGKSPCKNGGKDKKRQQGRLERQDHFRNLDQECWFVVLLRSDIQKFLVRTVSCFGGREGRYRKLRVVCSSSESKLSQGEKNVRVIGRKKRKTVRDNGVINSAVTQDAVCKGRWVQKNECKLFGGPVFEKPVAGLALRSTSCTCVRGGES